MPYYSEDYSVYRRSESPSNDYMPEASRRFYPTEAPITRYAPDTSSFADWSLDDDAYRDPYPQLFNPFQTVSLQALRVLIRSPARLLAHSLSRGAQRRALQAETENPISPMSDTPVCGLAVVRPLPVWQT